MTDILITKHARERIIERLGCRKDKVEKVVLKAWKSKEKIKKKTLHQRKYMGYGDVEWRIFQGCLFCFDVLTEDNPKLITVIFNQK